MYCNCVISVIISTQNRNAEYELIRGRTAIEEEIHLRSLVQHIHVAELRGQVL